eukprot:3917609-Amphidinium_carterae.4
MVEGTVDPGQQYFQCASGSGENTGCLSDGPIRRSWPLVTTMSTCTSHIHQQHAMGSRDTLPRRHVPDVPEVLPHALSDSVPDPPLNCCRRRCTHTIGSWFAEQGHAGMTSGVEL